MNRASTILRFSVSAVLASAFLLVVGGWLVHRYVGHRPSDTVGLTVIRGIRLISHVPGTRGNSGDRKQAPMLTGFVQIGYTVGPDGRAHGVHVIRAVPAGYYDQAAREIVANRRFKPATGKAAGRERTEVINFQVPASVLARPGQGGGP